MGGCAALLLRADEMKEWAAEFRLNSESKVPLPPLKDYSDRSGFPNARAQPMTV
jgi:hypothetical protein